MKTITSSIIKKLKLPKPSSRKGENGRLLIIAGSDKYFGALVYAGIAASRIVDLVYVLTTEDNRKLIKKMKLKTAEFMPISSFPPLLRRGIKDGMAAFGTMVALCCWHRDRTFKLHRICSVR